MGHAGKAIDEVRRAELYRQGGSARDLVKGKRWLLLSRWGNLTEHENHELTEFPGPTRRIFMGYIAKEYPDRLWEYQYGGSTLNYLQWGSYKYADSGSS
jgi:hypothetical protein